MTHGAKRSSVASTMDVIAVQTMLWKGLTLYTVFVCAVYGVVGLINWWRSR